MHLTICFKANLGLLVLCLTLSLALVVGCGGSPTPISAPQTSTSPPPTPAAPDTPTPVRAVPHIPIPTRIPTTPRPLPTNAPPLDPTSTPVPTPAPTPTPVPEGITIAEVGPSMEAPICNHTGILLDDSRVLVAGGFTGVANNNFIVPLDFGPVQVYSPVSEEWTLIDPVEGPGLFYSAVKLPDGKVIFVGLEGDPFGELSPMAALFDPSSDTWSPLLGPSRPRFIPYIGLLNDGRVLVTDGPDDSRDPDEFPIRLDVFDSATGQWQELASLALGFEDNESLIPILSGGSRLLLLGAIETKETRDDYEVTCIYSQVYVYDFATDEWNNVEGLNPYFIPTGGIELSDGRVLILGKPTRLGFGITYGNNEANERSIIGGRLPDGTRLTKEQLFNDFLGAKIYDPVTGVWTSANGMAHPRIKYTLTLLSDGRVIATGGEEIRSLAREDASPVLPSEVFDPTTGTWSQSPSLTEPRTCHSATLLSDGRVLLAGGLGFTKTDNPETLPLTSSEIINPDP